MTWVTWRQHRREAAIAGLALGVIATYLLITGRQMYTDATRWALFSCHADANFAPTCSVGFSEFMQRFLNLGTLTKQALVVLPAVLGVFIGAPLLAREVDQGTHVLLWTQSTTRMRWFSVNVLLLGGFTLVGAAALAGLANWWHRPLDLMFGNGPWFSFDAIGVVPVAYALFAFALGVAAGTLIQRTVPAMAATLLLFTAARVAIGFLRPWYLAPVVKEIEFTQTMPKDAFGMNLYWVDGSNNRVPYERVNQLIQQVFPAQGGSTTVSPAGPGLRGRATPISATDASAIGQYLHDHGFRYFAVYQPGERFWTFQAIEADIFVLLALLLLGLSAWWLRHRVR